MGYNKARALKAWEKEWAEKEIILREHNFTEEMIKELRAFEKKQFNRERKFYEHSELWDSCYLEDMPAEPVQKEINTIEDMLNCIEDEELLRHLKTAGKDVLVFFLLSSKGFTIEEIAAALGVTKNQIYGRVDRFRKKYLKKRKN